jgi:integrase
MPTFGEWSNVWWRQVVLPHHKPTTQKRTLHALEAELLPAFGLMRLDQIGRKEIRDWFEPYSCLSPGGANRVLDVLSAALGYAVAGKLIPRNPVLGIRRNLKGKRTRVLTGGERERLLAALDAEDPGYETHARAAKMLMVTSCRLNEVIGLVWSEVGEDGAALNLRDSKTGPRKVDISDEAREILAAAKKAQDRSGEDSAFVFPDPRNTKRCLQNFNGYWGRLMRRAKIKKFPVHSLRHNWATQAMRRGIPYQVIRRALGHKNDRETWGYIHVVKADIKAAAKDIGDWLAKMLRGEK